MIFLILALIISPEKGDVNTPFVATIEKNKITLNQGIEKLKRNPHILFLEAKEDSQLHFTFEPLQEGEITIALADESGVIQVSEAVEVALPTPTLLSLEPVIPFELNQTNEIYFNLLQSGEPSRNKELIRLKTFPWIPLITLLAIGTLLPLGINYLRTRTKKVLPPEEVAWEELKEMQIRPYNSPKDLYEDLTDVIREYIEKKYNLPVSHLTTEEFFKDIPKLKGINTASLQFFLIEADKVKFALKIPTPKEVNALVQAAKQLIQS